MSLKINLLFHNQHSPSFSKIIIPQRHKSKTGKNSILKEVAFLNYHFVILKQTRISCADTFDFIYNARHAHGTQYIIIM